MTSRILSAVALTLAVLTGAAVAAPVEASATAVASSYDHASEYGTLRAGAQALGQSDAQFQKTSVAALAFIFGISGVTSRPIAAPGAGNHTVSSTYSSGDLATLDRLARTIRQTRTQAQKTASLFVAFLLALG